MMVAENNSKAAQVGPRERRQAKTLLRDIAFVLKMTAQVKKEILSGAPRPR